MMQLFHGSDVVVRNPLAKVGRKKVDFGQGFYLVIDTVEDNENGIIAAEQELGQLIYKKVNHQICIRSQKVIDSCLAFVEASELERTWPMRDTVLWRKQARIIMALATGCLSARNEHWTCSTRRKPIGSSQARNMHAADERRLLR